MSKCPARIRPFPGPIILECENDGNKPHTEHRTVLRDYAYPGSSSVITWQESDRRNFTGEWVECAAGNCVLPNGHRGDCAS